MPNWKKSSSRTLRVGVLLFDQFSNHCLANAVEPLRAANMLSGRALYEWRFLTVDGRPVHSSSGLAVSPDGRLEAASGDMLMVMPSYGVRDIPRDAAHAGLRAAARRFRALAGLDTGSWLLAAAGLLEGRRATIHWEELNGFAEAFPDLTVERARFVIDGDRITCSGAMAAFDLVLHLIGAAQGQALAMEIEQLFMTRDGPRSHAGGGRLVRRALAAMQENLETPLAIGAVAAQAGCSARRLSDAMRAALGAAPQVVYKRLRLNYARKLARETEFSVAEIAWRSGYENPSALTRAYRAEFGVTPRGDRG